MSRIIDCLHLFSFLFSSLSMLTFFECIPSPHFVVFYSSPNFPSFRTSRYTWRASASSLCRLERVVIRRMRKIINLWGDLINTPRHLPLWRPAQQRLWLTTEFIFFLYTLPSSFLSCCGCIATMIISMLCLWQVEHGVSNLNFIVIRSY